MNHIPDAKGILFMGPDPSDPEAVGFRGLYQTELGNRYVWVVLSRGKMIRVVAAVFAPTDFAAMTADIEWKIFGVPNP
ncbi:hypothetical protein CV103_17445 [Sphingomonas fennica]|uniref:Uncharacterized protein n=2 Tax=Edaphosphingomonas fennica TaxID=114404 RepID=A0A2T4HP46_9SPHN|nr:hypothetical protein CV103_17445 [Sphingomonas fennica]